MVTYEVTASGPLGFQVSASGAHPGTHLIGDFASLAEAEAFIQLMLQIDAGPTSVSALLFVADDGFHNFGIDDLIRSSQQLRELAAKVRSKVIETKVKARHLRAVASSRRDYWCELVQPVPDALAAPTSATGEPDSTAGR